MNCKNQTQTGSKPYQAPLLTRFGSVVELTRNNAGSGLEAMQGGNDTCNGMGRPC